MSGRFDGFRSAKTVRVVDLLAANYGRKWKYDLGSHEWRDDTGRTVRRCVVMGGMTGDEEVGTQMWMYEDGKTPVLVAMFFGDLGGESA